MEAFAGLFREMIPSGSSIFNGPNPKETDEIRLFYVVHFFMISMIADSSGASSSD